MGDEKSIFMSSLFHAGVLHAEGFYLIHPASPPPSAVPSTQWGFPSVSSAQTSPLRSTFTHWVLFPDLTPLSSPGRDPKLKSVHYRIPVSPPRSVSLHWNFPPRSRAPRSPTTSIRSPEPLLFYFPLNPPLIFSSTANSLIWPQIFPHLMLFTTIPLPWTINY